VEVKKNMNFTAILAAALLVGVVTVPFVAAAPIQAYFNGAASGDLLRTQDRDQLRLRDCDCSCDGTQERIRLQQCLGDAAGNGTINTEQYRYECRYRLQQP
jgi:hypothetical protein